MGNIKEIYTKNRTYDFFDDMINIAKIDPNLRKIDKKKKNRTKALIFTTLDTSQLK